MDTSRFKIRLISNNSNRILLLDYLRLSLIVGTAASTPSHVSSPASSLESMSQLTYMGAFGLIVAPLEIQM